MAKSLRDALRVPPGEPVDLAGLDPRATPLAPGGKRKTADAMAADGAELARLQEALFASGDRRVLVVLQGMDTSGKGGVIEHVIGLVTRRACTSTRSRSRRRRSCGTTSSGGSAGRCRSRG